MQNPFIYGNEVFNEDFCNRKNELEELRRDITNGLNVLLYAPRRFGKTSLLRQLEYSYKDDKSSKVIFLDFFSISDVDEFIQKYFDLLSKAIESSTEKILKIFKETLKIRPSISIKANQHGDITYGLTFSNHETEIALEDVLNLPFEYAKKNNIKMIIIFDEFQEIEQLNIEKKLRSAIQSHGRYVSYIFSGSKKTILSNIFNDNSRAFYKSVKHFQIDGISLSDWTQFITEKFDKTSKKIKKEHIETIFDITKGFPYYMQQLMYTIWEMTEFETNNEIITKALKITLNRENDLYATIWSNLTPNQKKTLKYLIATNGIDIYSINNMSTYNFAPNTLKSTIEALLKKDIIDKKNDRFYIIDPFMEYWIKEFLF